MAFVAFSSVSSGQVCGKFPDKEEAKTNPKTTGTSMLTGTIYDPLGAVVVGAKVTAIGVDGKKIETASDCHGDYVLNLPFIPYDPSKRKIRPARFDIIVESYMGFERSETNGFLFIPTQLGRMQLDIALEPSLRY